MEREREMTRGWIIRAAPLALAAALLSVPAHAAFKPQTQPCKPSTTELTRAEQRNVKAACAEIEAQVQSWSDAAGGARKLGGMLADNFTWVTPTTQWDRFHRGDKADYIRRITVDQADRYATGSTYRILHTTAQDDRVAIEMLSAINLKDGTKTQNRYHLLYRFDADGKLLEARHYLDTAAKVNDDRAANTRIALAFLDAVAKGAGDAAGKLLAEDVRWIVPTSDPKPGMDRATAIQVINGIPAGFQNFSLTVFDDERLKGDALGPRTAYSNHQPSQPNAVPGVAAERDKVAIEALSRGTHKGRAYENRYQFLFTVRDGLIHEIKEYNDTRHLAEVLSGG